jgi:hypothetical protein
MIVQIKVENRTIPFMLNWEERRWESSDDPQEGDFPLIAELDGKRYGLYSDETFAEVEK